MLVRGKLLVRWKWEGTVVRVDFDIGVYILVLGLDWSIARASGRGSHVC